MLNFVAQTGVITDNPDGGNVQFQLSAIGTSHEIEVSSGTRFEVKYHCFINADFSEGVRIRHLATTVEINHLDLFPLPKDADSMCAHYDPIPTQDDLCHCVNKGTPPAPISWG